MRPSRKGGQAIFSPLINRRPSSRSAALTWGAAIAIAIAACGLVYDHTRMDSASFDEPLHIQAAFDQIFEHRIETDMGHPPFAKDFAGFGMKLLSPSPVESGAPGYADFGHGFVFRNRVSPDRILRAARAPMLCFFLALLLLTFGAARFFFGTPAGFFALILTACEPNLLAHAGIVATDLPVTFFWLAALLSWGAALRKRSVPRIVLTGIVMGAAFATKFSAVYLLPSIALVAVAWRLLESRDAQPGVSPLVARGRRLLADGLDAVAVLTVALVVVTLIYQPSLSSMTRVEQQRLVHAIAGDSDSTAARVMYFLADRAPGLGDFLGGIVATSDQNAFRGGINFLNGKVSLRGFPSYFFVAFLVKTSPGLLIGVLVSLVLLFRRKPDFPDVLLLLPIVYYFFFSMSSGFNIGVRHILPVYPLLAVASSRLVRVPPLAMALAAIQIAVALQIHPHELSYFNPVAGGTARGGRILADSNTDWGLDLRRLAEEIRRRGVRDPTVCYFGGDDVFYRLGVPDFAAVPVVRGRFVAISATLWDIGPYYFSVYGRPDLGGAMARLIAELKTRGRLVGMVGGSTYLYELPSVPPARRDGRAEKSAGEHRPAELRGQSPIPEDESTSLPGTSNFAATLRTSGERVGALGGATLPYRLRARPAGFRYSAALIHEEAVRSMNGGKANRKPERAANARRPGSA